MLPQLHAAITDGLVRRLAVPAYSHFAGLWQSRVDYNIKKGFLAAAAAVTLCTRTVTVSPGNRISRTPGSIHWSWKMGTSLGAETDKNIGETDDRNRQNSHQCSKVPWKMGTSLRARPLQEHQQNKAPGRDQEGRSEKGADKKPSRLTNQLKSWFTAKGCYQKPKAGDAHKHRVYSAVSWLTQCCPRNGGSCQMQSGSRNGLPHKPRTPHDQVCKQQHAPEGCATTKNNQLKPPTRQTPPQSRPGCRGTASSLRWCL